MTTTDRIVLAIYRAGKPLALHEFDLAGVSQNNLGTRLPEAAKIGLVVGIKRAGEPFKEWDLTVAGTSRAMDLAAMPAEAQAAPTTQCIPASDAIGSEAGVVK